MRTPPFLIAAALLFWGWQADFLFVAAAMAVVLEGSRLVGSRWEFSNADLNRTWDLTTLLFLGAMAIIYSADQPGNPAFTFAQWQPFIFYPAMLAQAFGNREEMPLSTFSWFLRRMKDGATARKTINISFLYFAVCLLGANATNRNGQQFYIIMAVLLVWALWAVRPRTISVPVWTVVLSVVVLCGYLSQRQLHELQASAENAIGHFLLSMFRRDLNARETRTMIGQIGKLKLSGKIVARVEPQNGTPAPLLLREATYDNYKNGLWWATKSDYATATIDTNDNIGFLDRKMNYFSTRIASYLPNGRGILPLPHGTFEALGLPAALDTNSLGVAKVKAGPGLANFIANYGPGQTIDGPPTEIDIDVLPKEQPVLDQVAAELGLKSKTDEEKINTIAQFFQDNFTYSLDITSDHIDKTGEKTALGMFLTKTRSGHCEYFATATVLLLRTAKIPARYGIGYVVPEKTKSGNTYIIRERHAHAWVLAHVNGHWIEVDTTPASWLAMDEEGASFFEPVSDVFAWIKFQIAKWRWSKTTYTKYLIWLLVPLVLFLVWRIVFNKNRNKARRGNNDDGLAHEWPGLDSEFYRVEKKLAALGFVRAPGEPLSNWKERIGSSQVVRLTDLDSILLLHQKYRFDPNGLNHDERTLLRQNVENFLAEIKPENRNS